MEKEKRNKNKMKAIKRYEVSLNYSCIVEAENEEEAKEEMRKVFDDTLLKLDCKEIGDYCTNCMKFINQIDLGDGSFGCGLCGSDNSIEIREYER